MTSKVTIPNTFATATTAIPLSQLDGNFSNVNAAINNALTYSNYAIDSGTANNYAITISGQTTTYVAGIAFQFKAANTNTGASTLNVNAQGTQSIVRTDGTALSAGDIIANGLVSVMYDGTNFQLMNDAGGKSETVSNLTVSGNLTLSGGTANGVVYLDSSKVATTGSAITFNGTNFTTTGSATATSFIPSGSSAPTNGLYLPAANAVGIATNSSERVRVDSSGYVLVGATSSVGAGDKRFEVQSGSNQTCYTLNYTPSYSYSGVYNAGDSNTYNFWKSTGNFLFGTVTDPNTTGWTERARITSGGDLLVGTTTSSGVLTAYKNASGRQTLYYAENASTAADAGTRFRFKAGTQTADLYLNGSGNDKRFYVENNGSGVYLADGGTSWTNTSDERFKDIIEPITNAANKVSTLRAVIGKFKTDSKNKRRSFLIAQDVLAVFPEAVDADNEEKLGLSYTDVIPLLVAAIKEQTIRIEALEAEVAAMKAGNGN